MRGACLTTHGQKVHDFINRVLAQQYARPIALGPNARTRIHHVHYKPLYRAIGDTDNRHRRRPTIEQSLERLFVLDGVLMDPSLTWLGTEREKRTHFAALSGLDMRDNEYPRLVFGRAPRQTVRYFPDKLPIVHAEYGRTHVFLYPVHAVDLVHFSLFLLRHQQLLHALPFWTIRVLLPRPLAKHADSFRWATRAALATPSGCARRHVRSAAPSSSRCDDCGRSSARPSCTAQRHTCCAIRWTATAAASNAWWRPTTSTISGHWRG